MIYALDTETALIEPGNLTPALTCLSSCYRDDAGAYVTDLRDHVDARECFKAVARLALSGGRVLVGANIAYDLAVLWHEHPELRDWIWCLYDEGKISDVQIRQKLIDIAIGQRSFRPGPDGPVKSLYGLEALTKLHLNHQLEKGTHQLRYGELRGVPLHEWPPGAREYPVDDAVATFMVHEAQETGKAFLESEADDARAAWSLHLMSVVGLRTNPAKVAAFKRSIEDEIAEKEGDLIASGLLRTDGSRDTKAAKDRMTSVCGGSPKMTKPNRKTGKGGGNVALDGDTCLATGDPLLVAYAEISSDKKILSTDIPLLEAGTVTPIQTRFEVLLKTGRTSSGKGEDEEGDGNVQNVRRKPGLRECYEPRPGYVYIDVDYPMLELHTWAEICTLWVGFSQMAQALAAGEDPHTQVASQIIGCTYAEAMAHKHDPEVKNFRNCSKVGNFGLPGGLGVDTFVEYAAKSYKVKMSHELASTVKQTWKQTWGEADPYFKFIHGCNGVIKLPYVGLVRGEMDFCSACNFGFQGLGAAIAKRAAYKLARACYIQEDSPLFGSLPVNFMHDQFLVETRDTPNAHDAAYAVASIMHQEAVKLLPHVGMRKLEPLLCRFWSKDAEAVFGADGRLVPWEGKAA